MQVSIAVSIRVLSKYFSGKDGSALHPLENISSYAYVTLSVCAVFTGQFEALCPGGYGYVRETRGDKIEGTLLVFSTYFTRSLR